MSGLFALHVSVASSEPILAIVGVDVVNPIGIADVSDSTVLISGQKIVAIGPSKSTEVPPTATVIDGDGRYLIPGLIDLHVHFQSNGSSLYAYKGGQPTIDDVDQPLRSALVSPQQGVEVALQKLVRSGITTARSLGESFWAYEARATLKQRAAQSVAPHIVLSSPGFYPRFSWADDWRVTTEEQARSLVERYSKSDKVDLLKVWFVHGKFTGEDDDDDDWKELLPIVEAFLDEAHKREMPNSVDAIEADKAKAVIKLGGNLAHGVFFGEVDDEYLALMKQHRTQQVMTLVASVRYFGAVAGHLEFSGPELLLSDPNITAQLFDIKEMDTDDLVIPDGGSRFDGLSLAQAMQEPPYLEEIEVSVENLRRIHEHGIEVGIGTDTGITGIPFGAAIFAEFEYYRDAGMNPREILTAATSTNARFIGMQSQIGSVEVGKQADLVLLNSNPLDDIMNAADIAAVVLDGEHITASQLNTDSPRDVVTRLRNAYNSGRPAVMAKLLAANVKLWDERENNKLDGRQAVLDHLAKGSDGVAYRGLVDANATGRVVLQTEKWADGSEKKLRYQVSNNLIQRIHVLSDENDPGDNSLLQRVIDSVFN
ncbi:MAG: amidohydrolase family protein [Pseudomonadota bacterium]